MGTKRASKKTVSAAHKAAMAQGRTESRVVREYLEALRGSRRGPGRRRTVESIEKRLAAIEEQLSAADVMQELKLLQERRNLTAELAILQAPELDTAAAEAAFVKIAKNYSHRQGLTYATWRDVGVPPAVLKQAGLTR